MSKEFKAWHDVIEVTSIANLDPDPNWTYMDSHGHKHKWKESELPTLEWTIDEPADDEYPAIGHYACKQCGEEVDIGYLKDMEGYRRFTTGAKHYAIDSVEVSEEEYQTELKKTQENGKQ